MPDSLLITVGIEIEYSDVLPSLVSSFISNARLSTRWNNTRDASVSSPVFHLQTNRRRPTPALLVPQPEQRTTAQLVPATDRAEQPRQPKSLVLDPNVANFIPISSFGNTEVGGELVSDLIDTTSNTWTDDIYRIQQFLSENGEMEETLRDSIHVHVNVGKVPPVQVLRKYVRLALILESFMYRVSGFGRSNRGITNDFQFMRPFSKFGPPYLPGSRSMYFPVMDYNNLLSASTTTEFFNAYGDAIRHNNSGVKYAPSRYMIINFYKMMKTGGLEFRSANKTLQHGPLITWVEFCKAFATAGYLLEEAFITNNFQYSPLGENRPAEYWRNVLTALFPFTEGKELVESLVLLYTKSPECTYTVVPTASHLRTIPDTNLPDRGGVRKSEIHFPQITNIHTLEDSFQRTVSSNRRRFAGLSDAITKVYTKHKRDIVALNGGLELEAIPYNLNKNTRYDLMSPDISFVISVRDGDGYYSISSQNGTIETGFRATPTTPFNIISSLGEK